MTTQRQRLTAHASVLLANLIWSSWNVISRLLAKGGTNPLVFATYREILCALLLCTIAHLRSRTQKQSLARPARRDVALFLFAGGCLFCFQVSFLFGAARLPADVLGFSILLVPLLAIVATAVLGWESLPLCGGAASFEQRCRAWVKVAGVACAFVGTSFIVVAAPASTKSTSNADSDAASWAIGLAFQLMSCVGCVTFILAQRPLFARYRSDQVVAGTYSVAAVLATIVTAACADAVSFRMSRDELFALAYTVVLVGSVAYSCFTYANSVLPASVCSLYGITQPLLTSLLAWPILHELPSKGSLVGGPLIILGLVLTTVATPSTPPVGKRTLVEPLLKAASSDGSIAE